MESLLDLLGRAKSDSGAQTELCDRFQRLVRRIVRGYDPSFAHPQLIEAGRNAVAQAAKEYDRARGPFTWLADNRVKTAVKREWLTLNPSRKNADGEVVRFEMYEEQGESDEDAEEGTGLKTSMLGRKIAANRHERWEREYGEWGGSTARVDPYLIEEIACLMEDVLTDDEYHLLAQLYGFPGYPKLTQKEVAEAEGISQPAVSRRVRSLLEKVKDEYYKGDGSRDNKRVVTGAEVEGADESDKPVAPALGHASGISGSGTLRSVERRGPIVDPWKVERAARDLGYKVFHAGEFQRYSDDTLRRMSCSFGYHRQEWRAFVKALPVGLFRELPAGVRRYWLLRSCCGPSDDLEICLGGESGCTWDEVVEFVRERVISRLEGNSKRQEES